MNGSSRRGPLEPGQEGEAIPPGGAALFPAPPEGQPSSPQGGRDHPELDIDALYAELGGEGGA